MKTVAVVGLGSIGLRHAKNLKDLGCHVIGYDIDKGACKKFSDEIFSGRAFSPAEGSVWALIEFINDVDAVVIASPTVDHYSHILNAIECNKPTFVEKPIVSTREQWAQLHNLHRAKELFVGYNLRFHPCVQWAKSQIDSGAIGRPIWARFTCAQYNDKAAYLRDGVILNWSHEIDLALHLLGPAKVATSYTQCTDSQDNLTDIVLTHNSGVQTSIHLDYLTSNEHRSFTVCGEKGNLEVDLLRRRFRLSPDRDLGGFVSSYDIEYGEEMRAFLAHTGGEQTLGCSGREALEVVDICLEVRKQAGLD